MNENENSSDEKVAEELMSTEVRSLAHHLMALHDANRPNPAFADQLEAQLRTLHEIQATPRTARNASRRSLITLAASFTLIILLFLALPPLRSWAQDVIRKIGNISITNEPNPAENRLQELLTGTPTATPDFNQTSAAFTIQEMPEEELANYLPTYVPEDYYLGELFAFDRSDGSSIEVVLSYWTKNPPLKLEYVTISQTPTTKGGDRELRLPAGTSPIRDVTVRGLPGVWIEQLPYSVAKDFEQGWTLMTQNLLIWEENGVTVVISSSSAALPLEELLGIAQSLPLITPSAEEVAEPALPGPDALKRVDEIQAQVGFPVYFPTFMPSGFTVHERRGYTEGGIAIAAAYYNTPLASPDSPIVLYQASGSPVLNYTENQFSQHETVNVRGQSGEWVPKVSFNLYPKHLGAYGIQSNLLIWEEDGYTFVIQSNSLTLELSLRIAESLMLPE